MSEQATASAKTSAPARGRIELLDLARGTALLAMFVYHFAYDLSFFRLIRVDVVSDPGWRLFARLIAGSFLAIVGFSLILATRNGLNRKAYAKRFAMVAGAALLVTIGTWFAIPENFIFFGILHHIALASLLGRDGLLAVRARQRAAAERALELRRLPRRHLHERAGRDRLH